MSIDAEGISIADTKRHLLSLSATVGGILLVIVAIAIFGMHRVDRAVERNHAELDRLAELADGARVAQVTFKTQVQEWKNTLLRGYKAEDFAHYHDAFLDDRARVQQELASLEEQARVLNFPAKGLSDLKASHAELDKAYDEALGAFRADDPLSVRVVDARVRGKDRPINEAFDRFVADVKAFTDGRREVLVADLQNVAYVTQVTLWIAFAAGLAVLLLAVVLAMRAIRK